MHFDRGKVLPQQEWLVPAIILPVSVSSSSYRLQCNLDFGFARVRQLVPYLAKLGISDVYISPIFAARSDSTHGYDVIDPTRLNPELGGRSAYDGLAGELVEHGMGLVLDIVPNHMSATSENAWWLDVLTNGRESRWAGYFDIDWPEDEKIILPVHGRGLFSMLYGFLALEGDLSTVSGITFYEQGETAGLGGEITNPRWQQIWKGKEAFGETGELRLTAVKGTVDPASPDAVHQVDGLSGATMTTRSVDNLVKFWLGAEGYGPLLERLRQAGVGGQSPGRSGVAR